MTFCCTHRSEPYSAIIREASSCIRWEQNRELQPDGPQKERERDLGTHSSKWDVSHQIPPLRTQGILRKRKQKECKSQRGWRKPGEQGALNQLNKAQMNSVTEAASTGLTHLCTVFSAYMS